MMPPDWLLRLIQSLMTTEYTGRLCIDFYRGNPSKKVERRMTDEH